MAPDKNFIVYIVDQLRTAGAISHRKMFGEYAVYCNNKVVALVCDNQLFIKPTGAGRVFIGTVVEAPPYPGAKGYFLIDDKFEDHEWLGELVKITERELPVPKPKKKRAEERFKARTVLAKTEPPFSL